MFIWWVIVSNQFWHASTREIIAASLARITACAVKGLPKTIRCVVHLIQMISVIDFIKNHAALYFKDSSTTSRCAAMEVAHTIQRSWLKLERMTDMPAPIGPNVLEMGTRTCMDGAFNMSDNHPLSDLPYRKTRMRYQQLLNRQSWLVWSKHLGLAR